MGGVLSDVYLYGANLVAQTLKEVGYQVEQIASAIETLFGLGADAVAELLKAIGYSPR